jgi:hypothetical protein
MHHVAALPFVVKMCGSLSSNPQSRPKPPRPGLSSIIAADTAFDIISRSPQHQSFPKLAVRDLFFLRLSPNLTLVLDERVMVLDLLPLARHVNAL